MVIDLQNRQLRETASVFVENTVTYVVEPEQRCDPDRIEVSGKRHISHCGEKERPVRLRNKRHPGRASLCQDSPTRSETKASN